MAPPTLTHDTIGARIKERRLALGLTQRDLHAEGSCFSYISRIESGQRTPSLDALILIADRLQTTALYLLTGSEHADCPTCHRSSDAPKAPYRSRWARL